MGEVQCADERVVDRVWRRVLLEAGPLEQQVGHQHPDRGGLVLLACGDNSLIAQLRIGDADGILPTQAVDGDALALLELHEAAADHVVLGRLKDVRRGRLDDLLGVLGVELGDRRTSSLAATFPELLFKTLFGDPVERRAHARHRRILGFGSRHEENPCLLHPPNRTEHPQGEPQPADVLCGTEEGLGDVAPHWRFAVKPVKLL